MKTIAVLMLACGLLMGCKDEGTNTQDQLRLTVEVMRDSIQTGYRWNYLLRSNQNCMVDSVVCTLPSGAACGVLAQHRMKLFVNAPVQIGGSFCIFSEYENFRGVRRLTVFVSSLNGVPTSFTRTVEIVLQ
jgi:hypothetical protein